MRSFYATCVVVSLALLAASAVSYLRGQDAKRRMLALAPEGRVPMFDEAGAAYTIEQYEVWEAQRDGLRVDPSFEALRSDAREAGWAAFLSLVASTAAGLGIAAYRLLEMILSRFVTAKWAHLACGLACLASGFLFSGFVLSLIELSRLPKVQPT